MIKKKVMPMLLAAAFIFCMLPAASFAADPSVYDAGTPQELSAALNAASGGGTIRLTADIDYNTGIAVRSKTITFDLNGHTLNVASAAGHGLEVDSGGVVDMKGSGELNVSSSADRVESIADYVTAFGVYAFDGGKARVTSATTTATHGGGAACANGEGSLITVTGDVTSPDVGAHAYDRGHVIVEGNIIVGNSEEGHPAIYVFGNGSNGSLVEVMGNVTATGGNGIAGAWADTGGTIKVFGNINRGVICEGGTLWIGGNVTSKDYGVSIIPGGCSDVTIDGTITSPTYIEMGGIISASGGTIGTGDNEGYLVYTDGESTIRVKIKSPAASSADEVVYKAGTPKELSAALKNVPDGGTIRLTADIDYNTGISVISKAVTFDLNGHTLNVVSASGHALSVGNGGSVDMAGKGEFNVTSNGEGSSGVCAFDGGRAEVSNAKGNQGGGAIASGKGSCIRVAGDVEAKLYGAIAEGGGTVIVGGNAEGGVRGVQATEGGHVEVAGNVASTNGDCGIYAEQNSTAEVGGSVTASRAGAAGVYASMGSTVVVDGTITAMVRIKMSDGRHMASIDSPPKSFDAGYLVYTDGSNTVRVKGSPEALHHGPAVRDAGTPQELLVALSVIKDGEFIRLTADIDYNTGIVVTGKSITFDLNGHTLNVTNSAGNGLEVDYGRVDITGKGAFNVASTAESISEYYWGVHVHGGGHAEVTSATATGRQGGGACAEGKNSCIEVKVDVKSPDYGANAYHGAIILVGGNAEGGTAAAFAYGHGSLITIAGNATATRNDSIAGAYAETGAAVRVVGNAAGIGSGVTCINATVWVGGNVTGVPFGVSVVSGGHSDVTVDGTIASQGSWVNVDGIDKTAADGIPGKGDDAGYLLYTGGINVVRVRGKGADRGTAAAAGMTACPISDTQVEMEKEVVDIVVKGGCSYVTSQYLFHNTGKSTDLLAGFPIQYWGDNENSMYYSMTQLQWLRTLVDGKRVSGSVKKGLKPGGSNTGSLYFPQWYAWRMKLAANERVKVVNKYWMDNSAREASAGTVNFILRSGAAWKGRIGKLTVRMHPQDFELENTTFAGMQPTYIEENGTIIWEAEDIELYEDISVSGSIPRKQSGVNPYRINEKGFLPYRMMTLRMLRNFYAGKYNGTTWWGNRMLRRFGDEQSPQLYYCMGVSYYKLGYTKKALDMFDRISGDMKLYAAMSAYYKALICKKAGDGAGYETHIASIGQYLSRIPEDEMTWGAYWLKSRLADLPKPQSK